MSLNMAYKTHGMLSFVGAIFVAAFAYTSLKWYGSNQDLILSFVSHSNNYFGVGVKSTLAVTSEMKKKTVTEASSISSFRSPNQNFGIIVSSDDRVISNTISHSHDLARPSTMQEKLIHDKVDVLLEEARACMRKAKHFAEIGNRKLAYKLFKHALALHPKFTEALNEFGEFLEEENIVEADLLYQRALANDPSHTTALQNRQRTAPVVKEYDKKVFADIDAMKQELYKYSAHHPTLRNAMKEFYYEHIYHTIALEGNTLSLEEIRAIIDHRTAIAGKSIAEHSEVIGIVEALNYMNNTLLMRIGNITVEDIKNIHKRVLGYVDPVVAGEFRTTQVFVGRHIPPHPNDVEIYMSEFENWLNSEEAFSLHPVEYAAIAHYRLVYIHPFVDGNGRTARLLMNFILMKNGFPPVSIEVKDRWEYYECLIAANDGDLRPFIRFIASCTSKTLEDYLFAAELPYIDMRDEQIRLQMNKQDSSSPEDTDEFS